MPRVQQGQSTTVHCWQHGYLDQRRRVGKLMTATSENDDWLTDELPILPALSEDKEQG